MSTDAKLIKTKLGLLNLAEQLGNVSQACQMMGYSRDRFYRIKELYDTGGEIALQEGAGANQSERTGLKSISSRQSLRWPSSSRAGLGQVRVSNELRKRGIFVSPVESVVFGFVMTLRYSPNGWLPWRPRLPKMA